MKKQPPKYRKSYHSALKKDWYNVPKLEGGPYWPTCNCCNGGFGPIHYKKNKKLIHRHIRHRKAQEIHYLVQEEYPK